MTRWETDEPHEKSSTCVCTRAPLSSLARGPITTTLQRVWRPTLQPRLPSEGKLERLEQFDTEKLRLGQPLSPQLHSQYV